MENRQMYVTDLMKRLDGFKSSAALRARVPMRDGSRRILRTVKVGHHNPPAEITDGVPVEVFAEHWDGPTPAADGTVGDMLTQLGTHIDKAIVRVAVPTSLGHHRCLDVMSVGFGPGNEETPFGLVVEIECESWDGSMTAVIRDDSVAS